MAAQKEAEKAAKEKQQRDLENVSPAKAAMLARKAKRRKEEEDRQKYINVKIPMSPAEAILIRKKHPSEEELFEMRRLQVRWSPLSFPSPLPSPSPPLPPSLHHLVTSPPHHLVASSDQAQP